MKSAIDLSAVCEAANATFTATAALHLDITQEAADTLPTYVQSAHWGSTLFRTEVFVYGPPGTEFVSASVADGSDARPMRTDIDDLGRPVASFETFIRPGGAAEVSAVFSGAGEFGPLALRSTPMVQPTGVSIGDGCAG
ncbi:MAG TPA: hypothetical protein VEX88_05500, partial [Glaciibacter sp.]|nr:hypothetical protein [Glaciibacter sp.]